MVGHKTRTIPIHRGDHEKKSYFTGTLQKNGAVSTELTGMLHAVSRRVARGTVRKASEQCQRQSSKPVKNGISKASYAQRYRQGTCPEALRAGKIRHSCRQPAKTRAVLVQ